MAGIPRGSARRASPRGRPRPHIHLLQIRSVRIVFPGVILESHNRFFEVRSRKTNVAFAFDQQQGRITERRL